MFHNLKKISHQVNTVDRDDEDDGDKILDVCYFIVGGNEEGIFELMTQEHELMTNRMLDREQKKN